MNKRFKITPVEGKPGVHYQLTEEIEVSPATWRKTNLTFFFTEQRYVRFFNAQVVVQGSLDRVRLGDPSASILIMANGWEDVSADTHAVLPEFKVGAIPLPVLHSGAFTTYSASSLMPVLYLDYMLNYHIMSPLKKK